MVTIAIATETRQNLFFFGTSLLCAAMANAPVDMTNINKSPLSQGPVSNPGVAFLRSPIATDDVAVQ